MLQQDVFSLNGLVGHPVPSKHKALAPHSNEKESFLEKFKCENSFCKKSRNLSWVGSDFSLKCLNFPKNAWNFALFEIWSGCKCDMKIILVCLIIWILNFFYMKNFASICFTKFHRAFLSLQKIKSIFFELF